MSNPIIPITIAYLVGLVSGSIFNYFPITVSAAIIIFIIVEAKLYRPYNSLTTNNPTASPFNKGGQKTFLKHLPFLFLIFLFGLFYYQLLSAPPAYNDVSRYIGKDKITIEGIVYKPPDEYKRKDVVYVKARKVYLQEKAKKATGSIRLSIFNQDIKLKYGDIIRFDASLKRPRGFWNPGAFDYEAYLARGGIFAIASISEKDKIEITGNAGNLFFRTIFDMQGRISSAINASLTGPPAAILKAMIIGDSTDLTDEIRDAFMVSGTTHILSISGSHLGLIAVFIFFIARVIIGMLPERLLLRITIYTTPTKIAAISTIIPVVLYTVISGAQIATVRSMIMVLVFILAVLVDRGHEILSSLAISCLIMLFFEPLAIHDISFQFTMVSVLFIALALEVKRLRPEDEIEKKGKFYSLKNRLTAYLLITISVSLGTAPLVAYYFRQVAWIGLFANSIVVPFAGFIIVPLGLMSCIISLFTGNLFLSGLNEVVLSLFYRTVSLFSQIPYAEVHIASPGLFYLSVFYLSVFFFFTQKEINRRAFAFIGLMLFAIIARPLISQLNRDFKITFLDVGQGDSAVIEFPDKKVMIVDGGGIFSETFDIGRGVLAPYLWDKGIYTIDYLVLTHPQLDHVGGFPYLLEKMKIKEVWENGDEGKSIAYRKFFGLIKSKNILRRKELSDMKADIRDVKVSVIADPLPSPLHYGERERMRGNASVNDRSIVLKLTHGKYSLLFAADIGKKAQEALLKQDSLKSNIIKVPHHGARSSLNEGFIEAVNPALAVISVGFQNRYKHPAPEHVEAYEKRGAKVLRTDQEGAIIINISGNKINIRTYAEARLKRIELSSTFLKIFQAEAENIWRLTAAPLLDAESLQLCRLRLLAP